MNYVKNILWIGLLLSTLGGCTSDSPQTGGWSLNMRSMAESYEKLTPYMFNTKRYSDPKNEKFISLYLKNLNQGASELDQHTAKGLSGNDPLFKIGLKGLKRLIQKANESYFVESYAYSQKLLQASMNHCSTCHSRTNMGPTFMKWDQFDDITAKMEPTDHASLLVATRQFPKAVTVLEEALNSQSMSPQETIKIVKQALFITLKNLNDPQRASQIVQKLQKQRFSKSQNRAFTQWQNYLKSWQNNQGLSQSSLRKILSKQPVLSGNFAKDVHKSLLLHRGLSTEMNKNWRAKIYYALGKMYESLSSFALWNLPETYFETCITEVPGTKQSLKCYYALEARVNSAPTMNLKSPLYNIEKTNLRKLKALATMEPGSASSFGGGSGSEDL